jgi:bifunctional DNase/RNase
LKEEEMAAPIETQFVEMRIADVRSASVDADTSTWPDSVRRFLVVLEEVGGARHLRIWIAEFEGLSLALHLKKVQTPRPVTYAFVAKLLEALDGRLREVRITELVHESDQEVGVFYAIAVVEGPNGLRSLDARPSDALILATLTGAPIRVDPAVCEAAAAESTARATSPEGSIGASEIAARIVASWPGAHVAPSARPSH